MAAAGEIKVSVDVKALADTIARVTQTTRAVGLAFEAATDIGGVIDDLVDQGTDFSRVSDVSQLREYRRNTLAQIREDLAHMILLEARIAELEKAEATA